MRGFLLALAAFLLSGLAALAQIPPGFPPGTFLGRAAIDGGASYIGPGDSVSGAAAWYGLRAYNAANLNGTTKAVNLIRASDSTACDFDIAASGGLGLSDSGCSLGGGLTLSAFATQDATATCVFSNVSFTVACTGASSTPHVGSQITGAGVIQPCFVTAVGTFTAGAGNVTIANGSSTGFLSCGTLSAESVTFTYGLFVAKWYDLTGNGNTLLQATGGAQPYLMQSIFGALPAVVNNGFLPATMKLTISSVSDPITISAVAIRYSNPGGLQTIMGFHAAGNLIGGFGSGTSIAAVSESSTLTASATDAASHALQFVGNGATSSINVDGAITSGSSGTATSGATILSFGASNTAAATFAGAVGEAGFYASALSTPNQALLCHNQFAYWGTFLSC
jgi:hypothetical protein